MRGFQAGSAYVLVKPNLRGWDGAVRDGVTKDAPRAGRAAGSAIGSAMSTAVKASLATIGATAAIVGGKALAGGMDRLLNIEDAQAKMRALGYEGQQVQGIMDSALASVKGTAFGLGEAATTAANAVAAGIKPGQELTKYLTMTAGAATLAGTSMEEMGSIINKVNTTGVVYTDNLNQLADRGIPVFQWLAKEYGVTQTELSKMVSAGEVDAATFNKVISENVGGAAVIAADTTRGAWANMNASLNRVGANLLEGVFPFFKTSLLGITETLGPLEDKAKTVGVALGGRLAAGAEQARGFINGLTGDVEIMDQSARPKLELFGLGIRAMIYAFQDGDVTSDGFIGKMEQLGATAGYVWGELTAGIDSFAAAWKDTDDTVTSSGLPGVMERLGNLARQAFDWIKDEGIPAVRSFFAEGDTAGLGDAFSSIGTSLVTLAPALGDFLQQMPSFNDVVSVGATVLEFLADHVDTLRKWMPALVAGFVAYKGAQVANNLLGRQSALGMGMQLAATRALIISNRQLAAATTQVAAAETRSVATTNTATVAKGRLTAGTIAKTIADKAATAATKAWTIAQRALNFVLSNNPIGWLIKGLMVLGGALVLAYHSSDEFRAVVDRAWTGIKDIAAGVVTWFVGTALPWLQGAFAAIGSFAVGLWVDHIQPVFTWIGDKIAQVLTWLVTDGWPMAQAAFAWIAEKATWLWVNALAPAMNGIMAVSAAVLGWILNTGWPWMRDALQLIGDKATWLWTTAISPALNGIWGIVQTVFAWVRDTGWPIFRDALQWVGDKATWLWENVVVPAFNGIRDIISSTWDSASNILSSFRGGLDALRDKFSSVKSAIGAIWGGIIRAVAVPINIMIGFVNDSFIDGLNWTFDQIDKIPGVDLGWSIPHIPLVAVPAAPSAGGGGGGRRGGAIALAAGGILPGYSPGRDNMHFFSPEHGWLSLAGGEPVMRPEFGRAVGHGWIDAMNAAARNGGVNGVRRAMGLAGGGVIPGGTGGGLGDIWSAITGAGSEIMSLLRDPIGYVKDKLGGFLSGITAGTGMWGGMGLESLTALGSNIASWVKDRIFGADSTAPGAPVAGGMPWQQIWGMIQALDPSAVMTSNYRPGARTASGFTSYHGLSRAVDFVSRNIAETMRRLTSLPIPWTEAYYSPWGFMRRGQMVPRSQVAPVTVANHYDHGHLAFEDGGIFDPLLFDAGGYLPPGDSWVRNNTGKPEPLLRTDTAGPTRLHPADLSALAEMISKRPAVLKMGRREVALVLSDAKQDLVKWGGG